MIHKERKDYTYQYMIQVPAEWLFYLLTTIDGLNKWWEKPIKGNPAAEGMFHLSFHHTEEPIQIYVDSINSPVTVQWTILKDFYNGEWIGTMIRFELVRVNPVTCILHFRHIGLTPQLQCYEKSCLQWEQILQLLISESERQYNP